jgi:nucleoside-diphosphate-sugar epimerase
MKKVLIVGGSGEISLACVEEAVRCGHKVTVYNRGITQQCPDTVDQITGDIRDEQTYRALGEQHFDVVCQFLAFDTQTVERDIEIFAGHCSQYVFISSASAYQKPCLDHIISEETPLENPFWSYSRKKAACEKILFSAFAKSGFPATIVRPSHTYRSRLPGAVIDGDHQAWRILHAKPIIVHGDGQSLWTLTHAEDFARAFVQLLGHPGVNGQAYHITSDRAYTWDVIISGVGEVLGVEPEVRHMTSNTLVRCHSDWEGPLLGDKSNSVIFDNSKIKQVAGSWECQVSLSGGLKRASVFCKSRIENDYKPNEMLDRMIDSLIKKQDRFEYS